MEFKAKEKLPEDAGIKMAEDIGEEKLTPLIKAIRQRLAAKGGAKFMDPEDYLSHHEWPFPRRDGNMVTGSKPADSAILVGGYSGDEKGRLGSNAAPLSLSLVKALAEPVCRDRSPVEGGAVIARGVGVAGMVKFLEKCDQVDEPELIELVKVQLNELFRRYPDEEKHRTQTPFRPPVAATGGQPLSEYRFTRYFSKAFG